jgi:hypothetical protein
LARPEAPVSDDRPSFPARIFLAWVAYFRTLFDGDFAAGVVRLRSGAPALPEPAAEPEAPKKKEKEAQRPVVLKEPTPEAAAQLLALLQREGRFVDFLEEDVSGFSDAEIGAAARVVHEGCRKAVRATFGVEPIRGEAEEARVTLEKGFDASRVRLAGNVVGEAPFTGTLRHRGWVATKIDLPKLTEAHDAKVIAPAEVEL